MEERGAEGEWKCPPHFWIIDSQNVGRCKYCPAVKDFGKLQRHEERRLEEATKRGSERRLETVQGKRGRPRKHEQVTRETLYQAI